MSKPDKPPRFGRFFWCMNCAGERDPALSGFLTMDEAKLHLSEVHGINASGSDFQGKRTLIAHNKGPDYSICRTHWLVGDVVLAEEEVRPRIGMAR